ncbi:MAG: autoinducer binding domain-containing protein [Sulfurifustaceae bacterium]
MKSWAEDLMTAIDEAKSEREVFREVEAMARNLGFDFCAYGLRVPLPLSNPRTCLINNYPIAWQARYREAGYLDIDPTVLHGRRTRVPVIWSDDVFAGAEDFWHEAQSAGLRIGWAQSSLDANGVGGMLTLARSSEQLSAAELKANEFKMRWLVSVTHLSLARFIVPRLYAKPAETLTNREIEVLKWAADGKTSGEISEILVISVDTVNFHVKNAIQKLRTANKTAAVVRAAMLGLFN